MKRVILLSVLMIICQSVSGQSLYPGQFSEKIKVTAKSAMKAEVFELGDVRLSDSPFRENMERSADWLMSIGVAQLLHSFRTTAGVYAGSEGGYSTVKKLGGWESLDCELRGHITGHALSGLAMLYGSTGDEKYRIKADSLVAGLAEVQDALGENGYLGAFPENLINRNIAGKSVWAPWYTLHKIVSGLIDQYLYCDNAQAFAVARGMGVWAYEKLHNLSPDTRALMLRNEFGGINDSFWALYALTADEHFRWLGEYFYHDAVMAPLVAREDNLEAKHANTFIPKLIGEGRCYELTGDERGRELAEFFWKNVTEHQNFAPGCNSDKEKFIKSDALSEHLSGYTGESCNSYNMLKLTRHLFCWQPDACYMEFYEQALYNHIFGQQDPGSGMVSYFLPLKAGAHKVYSTPYSSFWCCVGSSFENQTKYGESIYFHDESGIYINLFIPSELSWREKNVKITQQTRFPDSNTTRFTIATDVASGVQVPLYLRFPAWSKSLEVKINGRNMKVGGTPGSYVTVERKWRDGDVVEVVFDMSLRLVETNDNRDIAAVVYGPIVLAAPMGTEGMAAPAPSSNPALHNDYYTYEYNIPEGLKTSLKLDRENLNNSIVRTNSDELIFEADGVKLVPLNRIHRERYVTYWNINK